MIKIFAPSLCVPERNSTAPSVVTPRKLGPLRAVLLAVYLSTPLFAQQITGTPRPPASSAVITGTIRDPHGAAVPGIRLTVVSAQDAVEGVLTADSTGAFTFTGLAPGTYRVTLLAPGFEPFASEPVVLRAGETYELPIEALPMATKMTTVEVTATLDQVAQAQIEQEEKQRILGFLPNYYTSYIWNAAPLTPTQKFHLAFRTITDPATFIVVAGVAGVEQAHKTFPGYGQGVQGFAKRFGGAYADALDARVFGSAIYPTLFHQDPRYFYQGSGSPRSRVIYAIVSTFICRGDNGRPEVNYSHLLSSFTAAGISNLYRDPKDRRFGLTMRNGLIIYSSGAIVNLMREFLSRKVTPNIPTFANGKP